MDATTVLNAKQAIAKHVNLKILLKFATTVEEGLTAEQMQIIQYSRMCPIGRWLDSPGLLCMQAHPAYRNLLTQHVQFHREMTATADLIAAGRFKEAATSMREGSSFSRTGLTLARAITAFNEVLEIAIPI